MRVQWLTYKHTYKNNNTAPLIFYYFMPVSGMPLLNHSSPHRGRALQLTGHTHCLDEWHIHSVVVTVDVVLWNVSFRVPGAYVINANIMERLCKCFEWKSFTVYLLNIVKVIVCSCLNGCFRYNLFELDRGTTREIELSFRETFESFLPIINDQQFYTVWVG